MMFCSKEGCILTNIKRSDLYNASKYELESFIAFMEIMGYKWDIIN